MAVFSGPVFDEGEGTWRRLKPEDIEAGATQLLQALKGNYISKSGKPKPVNMDVSELPYVRGLKPAARKLVQIGRASCRERV